MSTHTVPARDFRQAVASEFASRPTLRQTLSTGILQLLNTHSRRFRRLRLPDAEPLYLLVPDSTQQNPASPHRGWSQRPMLEVMLDALRQSATLRSLGDAGGEFKVALALPYTFTDGRGAPVLDGTESIQAVLDELEPLLTALAQYFCQAQVEYWSAMGSLGVSRDRWLQQLLKQALLQNLPMQGLDAQQVDCVHGLLQGGARQPAVSLVQVRLVRGDSAVTRLLPKLLVQASLDERDFLLWCSPSSVVRVFDSDASFAQALQEELGYRFSFDSLTWSRQALEGDVFAQQVAALLEYLLDEVIRAPFWQCPDVVALERMFAGLSDPARWFIDGYLLTPTASLNVPLAQRQAQPADSFAVQGALFELALAQAQSQGLSSLEQVEDLRSFTRERLRKQMLEDYPIEANYFADELDLTLTRSLGVPGGAGSGTGGGVTQTRQMTLTEFAIGNLASLAGWTLTSISHGSGQLIMDWMTPDYVQGLVGRVDIGGHYPGYVKTLLDAPATRSERCLRFAREWRCALLFTAIDAKLDGSLSENGLQCVVDYCRGLVGSEASEIVWMPLAFAREPGTKLHDQVMGMYVLFAAVRETVLLYRPLYPGAALLEYANLDAMMAAIRTQQSLQDSILTWLTPDARKVYGNGGFIEPHLGRPILDTLILPEPVRPPAFAASFWRTDVDEQMYLANRDLLVELANRESTSTTQSRWAILKEGAWLLFQALTVVLRGPVASVAWLVQGVAAVSQDLQAFKEGDEFERSAAVVDLLLNFAMVLMHARLPRIEPPAANDMAALAGFGGLFAARPAPDAPSPSIGLGSVSLPGPVAMHEGVSLDFSWRGASGNTVLAPVQRQQLQAMRSSVSLHGLEPDATGLYLLDGQHYVTLGSDIYPVLVGTAGVRIVDSQGQAGPWLLAEGKAWRIDAGLRLRGGMPKSRIQQLREEKEAREQRAKQQDAELTIAAVELGKVLSKHNELLMSNLQVVEQLEAVKPLDQAKQSELDSAQTMVKLLKQKVADDLAAVIENYRAHNRLLAELKAINPSVQMTEAIKVQRNTTQHQLIEYYFARYNHLTDLINTEGVGAQARDILINPRSDGEKAAYASFRGSLERVARWEEQLVELAWPFDEVLDECFKDDELVFTRDDGTRINKDAWLKNLIRQRSSTAIDLEFYLLADLGELCLNRVADTDERTLSRYDHDLMNEELRSAGAAHGELARGELGLDERIDVLNGVLDAYAEAEAAAVLLTETGGDIIHSDVLIQYRKILARLVKAAEKELAGCVEEKEQQKVRVARISLYGARGGKRFVVRTSRGRSVVGVETQRDGNTVVEQRSANQASVLKTFRKQGKGWVEEAPVAREKTLQFDLGKERVNAQRLLDKVESVIALGRQYLQKDEPIGLSSVIEGHVEGLRESLARLPRTEKEQPLLGKLQEAIERLEAARIDLLTSLYLTTSHPTAASLRFLVEQDKVVVSRAGPRKLLAANDYLDVYEVRRKPAAGRAQGAGLWEAHFHYGAADTPGRSFSKGHLKLWSQRSLGRKAQLDAASSQGLLLAIYRGDLRLEQAEGLIPFD
ncbi:dermonecrotic toxin domain-containing protein [Pseudomonas sp. NMI795_08]|uniref:dermonecrotic toxin domain-containing protein n=1 Tax=Pseudomonas sp. NMI795_08 TaxID=2903144 RepID=UPI001E5651A3|nr:DUF6543 domain-containing protein [Pseudomonas sp. NMI795_08]MCE1115923.1 hypothetical protein [Pseudomonas sp. NMI795_08]